MNEKEPRYRGDIVDCTRHGKGSYKYPLGGQDMIIYSGGWKYGIKHGANAQLTIKGQSTFSGDFKDGEITGKGIKTWDDGRVYEGEWRDGEMCGKGHWINKRTNEIFEGSFLDNKRHGFGTLQKGNESYKGYFQYHKYHGKGTLLRSNQLVMSGLFENGFASGNAAVDWMKTATMDCLWNNGLPSGFGYFSTKDRTYDFEGNFENSLPKTSEAACVAWAALERSDVEAEIAANEALNPTKKKDKKPAAAAKKGKNDKPTIEPQFVMQKGEALGNVDVRYATSTFYEGIETAIQALRTAYAAAKEAKPKIPPYDPAEEEKVKKQPPELCMVPNERTRKVTARIRPFTATVSQPPDSNQPQFIRSYSEPIDIWVKDLSLAEQSYDKSRFSPKSIVILPEDEKTLSWKQAYAALSSTVTQPPDVSFRYKIGDFNAASATKEENDAPLVITVSKNGGKNHPQLELNSYSLNDGQLMFVRFDEKHFAEASQYMTFIVDFSIDSEKCLELQKSLRPAPLPRALKKTRSISGSFDITVVTIKREVPSSSSSGGIDYCALEVVLVVPERNIFSQSSQADSFSSVPSTKQSNFPANTAPLPEQGTGEKGLFDGLPSWKGCTWELRLVTASYASSGTPAKEQEAETDNVAALDNDEQKESVKGEISTLLINEKRTLCSAWSAEDSFLPDYWHSLALTLSASQDEQQPSNGNAEDGNEEGNLNFPIPFVYKADLLVDGTGLMKAERRTKDRRRTISPSGKDSTFSFNGSESIDQYSSDASLSASVVNPLADWMEYFDNNAQIVSNNVVPSAEAEVDVEAIVEPLPRTTELAVGSSNFIGSVRCLAVCGRKNRVDCAYATSCYSNWRLDRSLPVQAISVSLPADQGSGGGLTVPLSSEAVAVPPLPAGYRLAKGVDFHLFCGTGQVAWDRVRIPSTFRPPPVSTGAGADGAMGPQLYALEIVDAVNEECITDQVPTNTNATAIPETEMERDIGKMVKMVRRVPAFDGIVFTIEAADM